MNTHLLEIRDIAKSFTTGKDQPAAQVLRGISINVSTGEFVSIVGPSGSGKSTLLYCMAGLAEPSSGSVSLLGQEMTRLGRRAQARLRRDHIGFIFQSYNLIPSLTAWENIWLPARLAGRKADEEQVATALESVGLSGQAQQKPATLSGGQQQRVAIARVLAMRPDIVFADEPTGALDTEAGAQVLSLLRETADQGCAVVMVTHDLQAAAQADRVLVLRDGAVERELTQPTADQVFDAVSHRSSRVL
ncbi:ABC transporter ATP-binding protein [Streptomyces sp. NPDC002755]